MLSPASAYSKASELQLSRGIPLTTYSPGNVYGVVKPGQDAYIRVVPGGTPGSVSADEIIQFIGSRVQRGKHLSAVGLAMHMTNKQIP